MAHAKLLEHLGRAAGDFVFMLFSTSATQNRSTHTKHYCAMTCSQTSRCHLFLPHTQLFESLLNAAARVTCTACTSKNICAHIAGGVAITIVVQHPSFFHTLSFSSLSLSHTHTHTQTHFAQMRYSLRFL